MAKRVEGTEGWEVTDREGERRDRNRKIELELIDEGIKKTIMSIIMTMNIIYNYNNETG
jgi:hypothetical protein